MHDHAIVVMTLDQFDTYRHWLATTGLGTIRTNHGTGQPAAYRLAELPDMKQPCRHKHCDAYTTLRCARCGRALCTGHAGCNTNTWQHAGSVELQCRSPRGH